MLIRLNSYVAQPGLFLIQLLVTGSFVSAVDTDSKTVKLIIVASGIFTIVCQGTCPTGRIPVITSTDPWYKSGHINCLLGGTGKIHSQNAGHSISNEIIAPYCCDEVNYDYHSQKLRSYTRCRIQEVAA